jgi:hypothetical protein
MSNEYILILYNGKDKTQREWWSFGNRRPIETPDNNQGVSTEKAIMFGASAILLVAIVAFVISLFKKKK